MALERIDPRDGEERLGLDHHALYCFAAQFAAGRRVLDVACGTGLGSQLLRAAGAAAVVGFDGAPDAIEFARAHHARDGITFLRGDPRRLGEALAGGRFGLVVSFATLEHLADPAGFLREVATVAAEDALMILSVPNEARRPPDQPFPLHRFDLARLEDLLERAFPSFVIVPQYFSIASLVCPLQEALPASTAGRWRVARVGAEPVEPDGYAAVCRLSRTRAPGGPAPVPTIEGAVAHGAKSFIEAIEGPQHRKGRRAAWMNTAESRQTGGDAEASAWQRVAIEAEHVIEDLERLSRQIEDDRNRAVADLERRLAAVQRERHEAVSEAVRLAEELKRATASLAAQEAAVEVARSELQHASRLVAHVESSLGWRLARRLQPVFPADTRRGRLVRKLLNPI